MRKILRITSIAILIGAGGCADQSDFPEQTEIDILSPTAFQDAVYGALGDEVVILEGSETRIGDAPGIKGLGNSSLLEAAAVCSGGGFLVVRNSPHSREIIVPSYRSTLMAQQDVDRDNEDLLRCVANESSETFHATLHENAAGVGRTENGTALTLKEQ